MDALDAMKNSNQIPHGIRERVTALEAELMAVQGQWVQLGRIGAQREDHAAELLGRVKPQLQAIEDFVRRCRQQIEAMQVDPFCRKAG